MYTPPKEVNGVDVIALNDEQTFQNEQWISLIPEDEDNPCIWEFSITSGRIIQTKFE